MHRLTVLILVSVLAIGCGDYGSSPSHGTTTTSTFTVPLSPENEVPRVTNADASGAGTATIALTILRDDSGDIVSSTANVQISVTGFPDGTTVTGAHIHNGAAGVNAGVYVDMRLAAGEMAIANGSGSTTRNGITVPPDRASAILSNPAGHYFNVHTALNPDGAIRGQLSGGGATFDPGTPVPY